MRGFKWPASVAAKKDEVAWEDGKLCEPGRTDECDPSPRSGRGLLIAAFSNALGAIESGPPTATKIQPLRRFRSTTAIEVPISAQSRPCSPVRPSKCIPTSAKAGPRFACMADSNSRSITSRRAITPPARRYLVRAGMAPISPFNESPSPDSHSNNVSEGAS